MKVMMKVMMIIIVIIVIIIVIMNHDGGGKDVVVGGGAPSTNFLSEDTANDSTEEHPALLHHEPLHCLGSCPYAAAIDLRFFGCDAARSSGPCLRYTKAFAMNASLTRLSCAAPQECPKMLSHQPLHSRSAKVAASVRTAPSRRGVHPKRSKHQTSRKLSEGMKSCPLDPAEQI